MDIKDRVYQKLDEMGIVCRRVAHAPMHTMQDCSAVDREIGAVTVKNYFLSTRRTGIMYLCLVRPQARFRATDISQQVGSSRLSFGSEEQMAQYLHVKPGSVSPMGLIFDEEQKVTLLIDEKLKDEPMLAFHPCDNTQTLSMSNRDFFEVFLPAIGRTPRFVEIHDFM